MKNLNIKNFKFDKITKFKYFKQIGKVYDFWENYIFGYFSKIDIIHFFWIYSYKILDTKDFLIRLINTKTEILSKFIKGEF